MFKKIKKEVFHEMSETYKIQFSVSINKGFWNAVTVDYFCTEHGCSHATMAELGHCDCVACQDYNIYYLAL